MHGIAEGSCWKAVGAYPNAPPSVMFPQLGCLCLNMAEHRLPLTITPGLSGCLFRLFACRASGGMTAGTFGHLTTAQTVKAAVPAAMW